MAASSSNYQDPLRLLRATLASKQTIHLLASLDPASSPVYSLNECSHLSFPSASAGNNPIVLPKITPTRFKRTPQSLDTETWDIQSLLLCYLKKDASIAEYAQEAVKQGVELVGIMQRRIVSDYLEGKDTTGQAAPYIVQDISVRDASGNSVLPVLDGQAAALEDAIRDTTVEATLAGTITSADKASSSTQLPQSATATASTADAQRPAKKARYVVNKEDLEACKRISSFWEPKQIADRTSVLRGTVKKANFASVREMVHDRLKHGKEEVRKAAHGHPANTVQVQPAAQAPQKRRRNMNPIIIISPSSSALITMHNVKRFLEESHFEPSDIARQSSNRNAEDVVHINHKRTIGTLASESAINSAQNSMGGGLAGQNRAERGAAGEKLVRYFVVDGVEALSKFGDDAWDRVVCVMTTGQEWQFRPYKFSEPKELFHAVKGIYPKYSNEPPNPKIASWNVSELKIDPLKRHTDKSVVSEFWRTLESWTAVHKQGIVDF